MDLESKIKLTAYLEVIETNLDLIRSKLNHNKDTYYEYTSQISDLHYAQQMISDVRRVFENQIDEKGIDQ